MAYETFFNEGLSPRLRGNRSLVTPPLDRRRSIPAPAGEPGGMTTSMGAWWVYPRACGGFAAGPEAQRWVYPRACGGTLRHSPAQTLPVYPRACGGTLPLRMAVLIHAVYPRACGGTPCAAILCIGLSD